MKNTTILKKYPDLFVDRLNNYSVIYNPISAKGVLVLDISSSIIFDLINNNRTINEICVILKKKYKNVKKSVIIHKINQLLTNQIIYTETPVVYNPKSTKKSLGVWFHITNQCNLRCTYCFINKTPEAMSLNKGKEVIKKIIFDAKRSLFMEVVINFAGGEPLLEYNKILQLIDYGNKMGNKFNIGVQYFITTNGILITKSVAETLKSKDVTVSLSLDGVGKYHNKHRKFTNGMDSYNYVKKGVQILRETKAKYGINITITADNVGHMPWLTNYCLKHNIRFTYGLHKKTSPLDFTKDASNESLIKFLGKSIKMIENNPPRYEFLNSIFDVYSFKPQHKCSVGHSYITVKQNGKLAPCPLIINREIGSINDDNIVTTMIQKGDFINDKGGLTVEKKANCKTCKWKHVCFGGCPIHTFQVKKSYFTNSPYCSALLKLFPKFIRAEGQRIITHNFSSVL